MPCMDFSWADGPAPQVYYAHQNPCEPSVFRNVWDLVGVQASVRVHDMLSMDSDTWYCFVMVGMDSCWLLWISDD